MVNLGRVYAVLRKGEVTADPPTGVYFGDTRLICELKYTLGGRRLTPKSVSRIGLGLEYTYSTPRGSFVRRIEPFYGGISERLRRAPRGLTLHIRPDFSDIFEVRGILDRSSLGVGKAQPMLQVDSRRAEVRYAASGGGEITFSVKVRGGMIRNHSLEITAEDEAFSVRLGAQKAPKRASAAHTKYMGDLPHLSADSNVLVEAYESSVRDLFSLLEGPPQDFFPLAGIPYFNCVFGRDSLITSLQTLLFQPKIAEHTLRKLSSYIGRKRDEYTEEEWGKVVHEVREGELSGRLTPFRSYYGSVDATPLFVVLYHQFRIIHPDVQLGAQVEEAAHMALGWVVSKLRGEGLLGYVPGVLRNQGWKDSDDSVFHADGSDPEPPIYLVEPQGYAEWALRLAAGSKEEEELVLEPYAQNVREKIASRYWSPEMGYFGEALDGRGKLTEIVTSNPGHLLWSGSLEPGLAKKVASVLVDRERLNSEYGVKTLGFGEPRHNPESYHNGSVWPHENSLILKGLADYGLEEEFEEVLEGVLRAFRALGIGGLPEHYSGVRLGGRAKPRALGCYPQAWAAGSVFLAVQAMLGVAIRVEGGEHVLSISPHIPRHMERLKIGDLYFLGGRLRVDVRRMGGEVRVEPEFVTQPAVSCRVES